MAEYIVYVGDREGQFSINSRVERDFKYRVQTDVPFKILDGDLWIASLRDMKVLSEISFVPTTIRNRGVGDKTYCSPFEGAFLEGLAANCPDPARVVEIGTGKGTSLLRILYGLSLHEDVRVWSIDLLEKEDVRELLQEAQIPNWRYELLVGDSVAFGEMPDWEPLDLIWVDGSHSKEGVIADANVWGPHLSPGGVMAFHDYGNPLHGVTEAVDEVMQGEGWTHVGLVGTLTAYQKAL